MKVKRGLSTVAAAASLLLCKRDGPTFDSVVQGFQAALDSHDDVERRYPGDALLEAATNPAFEPPPSPPSPPQPIGPGQICTVFVYNAGSQRMGWLYNFFVVRCLSMGLTFFTN